VKTLLIRHGAFTLLELLAVCATLAVAAALAVPALARGTVQARQAKCLANQRQIGLAILLFAADHEGELPQSTHTTGRRHIDESWIFTLAPYLDNIDEIRICPAETPRRQQAIREARATSYVLNDLVFDDPRFFRLTAIPFPARTLLLATLSENRAPSATADHIHGAEWTNWTNALRDIEPDRHRWGGRSPDRLKGSSNFLFADGHAEPVAARELKSRFDAGVNPAAVPQN
jgi:prepilin-type processing-associated H-X9-DG protein